MGALTDNRKRCFVDLCVPFSTSTVPTQHPSELSPGVPLKKPKATAPPHAVPDRSPPPPTSPSHLLRHQAPTQPRPQNLPPPAPLRRPVHGPQRILRVFGHGSSLGSGSRAAPEPPLVRKEPLPGMGNLISWSVNRGPLDALWSSRRKGKASVDSDSDHRFKGENIEGLNLDEYRRLVESAQEGRPVATPEQKSSEPSAAAKITLPQSVSSAVSDLTILTRDEDELLRPHVLTRKVDDARRLVKVEPTLKEDLLEATRSPLYKDLLLSARKRDSRLSSLDFEVKLTEKKISEFHKVREVNPEKDILGPFTPLTDEEENDVGLALRDPERFCLRKHEVLALHEHSNIVITREVIQCLRPGAWLNDEVINLYFELVKERERREPKKFLKCHFFNTFFYKKLISGRDNYDYRAVKRWTTQRKLGYGLIECDKIFVPIHKEIHWCLAVIDVKDERLLYLDSLGGMDANALRVLARYFVDEVKDKSNKTIDMTSWKLEPVDNLPLQKNGWDCGMFMLKYVDFYSRGLNLCFHQDEMIYFRKRTVKEILNLRAE
uniref:Ubiquitin-like-specific protease ESD4 n=1 Tax=Anthurium amnicola TaxID=1678845 RepID=A0A1D1YMT3_9ARAE